MKKMYVFILSFVLCCQLVALENMQERFLQGHQAYEQGDYGEALEKYQSITNPGPAVWYNRGNCFFALKNKIEALACWRRAQKYMNPDIYTKAEQNIDVVKAQHTIEHSTRFFTSLSTWLSTVSMHGSLLLWQIIFLLFWSISILGFPFIIKRKHGISLIICSLALILLGAIPSIKYSKMTQKNALVKVDSSLFIGPDDRFSQCGSVKKLQEISVVEKKDTWYKVSQGTTLGWIPAENLILI